MADNTQYFDFTVNIDKIIGDCGVEEILYINDLKQRKLYLDYDVSEDTVPEIVRNIIRYNKDDKGIDIDKRQPIILYITSNGGSVDSGFELIDVILKSKTPVYTVNLGYQYSMGFLIGLAGAKRFATPNSKFLMHDGSNFVYNSGAKAQDQMEFNRRVESRIKDYVISRSRLTEKEYDSKLRVEWYMFADEAKEKGFVDYIVGVDCDLDEII